MDESTITSLTNGWDRGRFHSPAPSGSAPATSTPKAGIAAPRTRSVFDTESVLRSRSWAAGMQTFHNFDTRTLDCLCVKCGVRVVSFTDETFEHAYTPEVVIHSMERSAKVHQATCVGHYVDDEPPLTREQRMAHREMNRPRVGRG